PKTPMKTKITSLITAGILGTSLASQAALSLIDDDFSSSTAVADTRFNKGDIDTDSWRGNGDWSISGGALTSAGTVGQSTHLINSVSSTATYLDKVTLSFDYSVGAGSTLYFYSTLFTGEAAASMAARNSKTDGTYWANDFNNQWGGAPFVGFAGPEYNLSGGGVGGSSTANAVTSFVGGTSGTFSQTYDISGFGGGDFSIADVSNVLAVFTVNADAVGDGAISIDNFNMTAVPEPSSTALLGLGGLALALRRRRS
ncbi:PEP-CTERM sorting domain-containing protein, partial [Akkermansiaceae bacterium]|nr:PEP-CTERM sorting domain-containing protein [Akkermansiaceae bacterium]